MFSLWPFARPMACYALSFALLALAPARAQADPRHELDPRCPASATLDPVGYSRVKSAGDEIAYATAAMNASATAQDCAAACCQDWCCVSFVFSPASGPGLSGAWQEHDSARGVVGVALTQARSGGGLEATSADPQKARWAQASGSLSPDGVHFWMVFDKNPSNNRTGVVGGSGALLTFERLPWDPPQFTLTFSKVSNGSSTCTLQSDYGVVVSAPAGGQGSRSGVRALLPVARPAYPNSSAIKGVAFSPNATTWVEGDCHPTTWDNDGSQYSGTGDNRVSDPSLRHDNSPNAFLRLEGNPSAAGNLTFTLQGSSRPITGPVADGACPDRVFGVANTKPSSVLSLGGVLYWAVSCFNYGDNPLFNRQRWGPTWIVTSLDKGATWNLSATAPAFFSGRLGAPHFIQFGQGQRLSADGYVYAYFPGTLDDAAYLSCNDGLWLGRVANHSILVRSAWEFFSSSNASAPAWTADASAASPVFQWHNMTAMHDAQYDPYRKRYVLPLWNWVSMDGRPRPDHSSPRLGHQRSVLTLLEAASPWGPFQIFHFDDAWEGPDGSGGGYCPVLPPAWVGASDMYMTWTQCCDWQSVLPPNHYSFMTQQIHFLE